MAAVAVQPRVRSRVPARSSRSVTQRLVDRCDIRPPRAKDPGHWRTHDGFVSINAGIIMDGLAPGQGLRALISFVPGDIQSRIRERIRAEIPDFDRLSDVERQAVWGRVLRIGKDVRTDRVVEIVKDLDQRGIDMAVHSLVVHRVSNTFFVTLSPATLQELIILRAQGYPHLRRITVETTSAF